MPRWPYSIRARGHATRAPATSTRRRRGTRGPPRPPRQRCVDRCARRRPRRPPPARPTTACPVTSQAAAGLASARRPPPCLLLCTRGAPRGALLLPHRPGVSMAPDIHLVPVDRATAKTPPCLTDTSSGLTPKRRASARASVPGYARWPRPRPTAPGGPAAAMRPT